MEVVFNGSKSKEFIQSSGVPQESILGPLLFNIYVNDIESNISSNISLYADDLKLRRTLNDIADCSILQDDINRIERWSIDNSLALNIEKCHMMSFTNKLHNIQFDYVLNTKNLSTLDSFSDLGVKFDSKLKFTYHYDSITNKAARMLGFLIRTARHFRNIESILFLYKSLVRSQLEYATIIWSPYAITYIELIEKIQRRFTRFIYKKFHIPYQYYEHRLRLLQMEPLYIRRKYYDLVYLYKIANGLLECSSISRLVMRVNNKNIRNMNLFAVRTYDIDVAKNSPIPRMLETYNTIFQSENYISSSISQFKRIVKRKLCDIW